MKTRKARLLALVVCFVMVATTVIQFAGNVYASDSVEAEKIIILNENGDEAKSEDVVEGEKTILTADCESAKNLQWQYYAAEYDLWISIHGETNEECVLTHAKIFNMLDENEQTKIRCIQHKGEKEIISNEVEITYKEAKTTKNVRSFSIMKSSTNSVAANSYAVNAVADDEVKATYSVVINYVFANGKQAANSWTANVKEGSSLSQTIKSPTVVGYTPDQKEVVLNIDEVTGDVTKTVTYNAADVGFKVLHYKQNVDNDEYTLVETISHNGFTEDTVGENLAKTEGYEGFYSLLYDADTKIAADGSTEIKIYYDRYYYLMNFDLDGGYGVEPVYARYGTDIEVNSAPTRAGYTFDKWVEVTDGTAGTDGVEIPKTMPAENKKYKAVWTAGDTTYDVVFWYENADDEGYSQAGVLENQTAKSGTVVNGSSYKNENFAGRDNEHFTYSHADDNVAIKGDGTTVINVYFSRNVYTLTFVMENSADNCTVTEHRHNESCSTLTCTKTEHNHESEGCELGECTHPTHTIDCYKGDYDASLKKISKPNYTLTHIGNNIYSYYYNSRYCVQIGDNWYENSYGSYYEIQFTCQHSHTDDCYTCETLGHVHNASCYTKNCTLNEHYHSNGDCYLIVTEKYDADITSVWNENPVKAAIQSGSVFQSSKTGDYYSFLEKVPGYDMTLTQSNLGSTNKTIYYYVETLPGEDYSDTTTKESSKNGVNRTYYLYNEVPLKVSSRYYLTYEEDYFPITGFTQRDSDVPSFDSEQKAYLYYTRNSYDLSFSNGGSIVADKGGNYLYQQDISGTYFVPDYPTGLEANAYTFEGWYTSPFYGDTKFDFTYKEDGKTVNATMPANDVTLYARWVPVEHTVKVYPTKADMESDKNQIGETETVNHRETATEPAEPTNGEYVFVGWFYMDGDAEKAFDFSMPVTKDIELYAKWSSNTLMEYTIHYQLADGTPIAADTTGSALAGTTKTFDAKAGEELMEDYQSGYFPNTNSHSIIIDIEDPSKNEFTFVYVPKEELPYKVMYLEYDGDYKYDGTETVLAPEKNKITRDAIVTETFVSVTGYMPDAYQKRLILSATESENVVIFWYVKDDVHAPVQVIHYVQNAEGEGYTEYQSSTDLDGEKGKNYSADVLNIYGYEYDHATANGISVEASDRKVSGVVTANGLKLELYYNREMAPYEFRYLEQGTEKVLADPVTGTARYGAQVTGKSKEIPGYECVSGNAQAITIQLEEGDTVVKNVRTFYYKEIEATINYKVVGPDGCGTVSLNSETIPVMTGTVNGSTANANDNFRFVGWYKNPECTDPVDEIGWVNDNKITPQKSKDYDEAVLGSAKGYQSATYYAKFEYALTDLTIYKEGLAAIDANQAVTFNIVGDSNDNNTKNINLTVTIIGNDSIVIKDLPVGKYTITEDMSWAARYKKGNATKEITLTVDNNEVTFTNVREKDKWLDHNESQDNLFNN